MAIFVIRDVSTTDWLVEAEDVTSAIEALESGAGYQKSISAKINSVVAVPAPEGTDLHTYAISREFF